MSGVVVGTSADGSATITVDDLLCSPNVPDLPKDCADAYKDFGIRVSGEVLIR